jgi:hypothetical protein
MNTDKELRALKELARVQGLTRTDPEDLGRAFAGIIAGVAQRQDRKMLEVQATVVPTAGRAEPSTYTALPARLEPTGEDDEDPAVIAEFERENS